MATWAGQETTVLKVGLRLSALSPRAGVGRVPRISVRIHKKAFGLLFFNLSYCGIFLSIYVNYREIEMVILHVLLVWFIALIYSGEDLVILEMCYQNNRTHFPRRR